MSTTFGAQPGHHERYLQRKFTNPLFPAADIRDADIQKARSLDAAEKETFLNYFRELVQQAVDFKPNADADIILKLKEQLDKTYEQCCGLAGDQTEIKTMLKRLLHAIMQAMWKGVGDDPRAQEKLEMEEQARQQHFALLEIALVADILRPDSLIQKHELVPVLLTESQPTMTAAFQLFSAAQQLALYQQAAELLQTADNTHSMIQHARNRLRDMQQLLPAQGTRPN